MERRRGVKDDDDDGGAAAASGLVGSALSRRSRRTAGGWMRMLSDDCRGGALALLVLGGLALRGALLVFGHWMDRNGKDVFDVRRMGRGVHGGGGGTAMPFSPRSIAKGLEYVRICVCACVCISLSLWQARWRTQTSTFTSSQREPSSLRPGALPLKGPLIAIRRLWQLCCFPVRSTLCLGRSYSVFAMLELLFWFTSHREGQSRQRAVALSPIVTRFSPRLCG